MAIAGRRADLVVIDDPVKSREEAERQGERDRVWDWYRSDLYSRTKPGARIVVIMTRWHEDDLGGRLLAEAATGGDRWTVLSLPAVCEDPSVDPLGRAAGDALWPEWEDARALARKRGVVGERDWQSQYQQRPRPAQSVLFDVGRISRVPVAPAPVVSRVRAWDLAATEQLGGRDPDWTVGLRMARLESGQFLVEDVVRMRGSPWAVEQTIVETGRSDGQECPISVPQDPGQAGKAQVAYLAAALAGHVVTSSAETGSKETRAMPWASQVEAGNVLVLDRPWVKALVDEMDAFPHGSKDDQVDAGSRAFAHLVPRLGAQAMLEYYGSLASSAPETPTSLGPNSRSADRRGGRSSGHDADDELVAVYAQTLARLRDDEDSLCARCARPVARTRVTDGVSVWHPECA
jgi:predicted phage terminase large subunit-like protein